MQLERELERSISARFDGLLSNERLAREISALTLVIMILRGEETGAVSRRSLRGHTASEAERERERVPRLKRQVGAPLQTPADKLGRQLTGSHCSI